MTRDNNPDRLDDGARAEAEMKEREAPASATESLLAEAIEALEPFAASPRGLEITIAQLDRARATLSRLKPGEKGGE